VQKAAQDNSFYTAEVGSSLWLGAQAVNAESIPFVGRAEQNLLLHFWSLTVLIFQPQQITRDGKNEFVGYTLAIPEVSDLEGFVEDYPAMLHDLKTDVRGYRPAEAVIDLPAQGALTFLDHQARLAAHFAEDRETGGSISSVEYVHLYKAGNNIKSLGAGRVPYQKGLVRGYRAIVGEADKPAPYRNPLFRRGLLLALLDPAAERAAIRAAIEKKRSKKAAESFTFKRDSILRMNLAKALEPYGHNAVFTQSPLAAEGSAYQNATTSALLHRETAVTAFQFPFALNLNDCKPKTDWTRKLLQAIGELNEVAGNHARSYYEMAPASILMRLTDSLVAGYNTYGFQTSGQAPGDIHNFPEVIDGILHDPPDYIGKEFYFGGKLVKDMDQKTEADLKARGVTLDREPRRLIEIVANKALGG
jgi:hypothetical protein